MKTDNLFEDVALRYEEATGQKLNSNKFVLSEASFTSREALESLQYEPSGSLAILLFRKAWNSYIKRNSFYIKDLLEPEVMDNLHKKIDFDSYLKHGKPNDILNNTMQQVQNIASQFDINNISEILSDENRFIDIFAEAYKNIYQKYTVDKFKCLDSRDNEPFIGTYEYKFHTLQEFVDCLRKSDNCFVCAKIDGLFDYEDLNEFDVFYAFGCRCGQYVYVNSDRDQHANPDARKKKQRRNPGKQWAQKADSTWMPYYDKQEQPTIVGNSTAIVKIDKDAIYSVSKISDVHDTEAKLIISISLAAMYQKYWIERTVDIRYNSLKGQKVPVENSYFSSEVKLLPINCKELALPNNLQLPVISRQQLETLPPDICNKNTFYDWYVKSYINNNELQEPIDLNDFVGSRQEVEDMIWWNYRKAALPLINERRTKDIAKDFYSFSSTKNKLIDCCPDIKDGEHTWGEIDRYNSYLLTEATFPGPNLLKNFNVLKRLSNNLSYLLESCLTLPSTKINKNNPNFRLGSSAIYVNGSQYDHTPDAFGTNFYADNLDNPNVKWLTAEGTFTFNKTGSSSARYWFKCRSRGVKGWIEECNRDFNAIVSSNLHSNEFYIVPMGTLNKQYEFNFIANSVWDLCFMLGCRKEELPKSLQRWLTERRTLKPYTGNSLLSFTDPIEDVFDWVDECFRLNVTIFLSKSDIKKYAKKLNLNVNYDSFELI